MGRFLPRLCSVAAPAPALCFPLSVTMPLLLSVCRPAASASSSANDIKSSCPWKPPPPLLVLVDVGLKDDGFGGRLALRAAAMDCRMLGLVNVAGTDVELVDAMLCSIAMTVRRHTG